MKIKVNERGKTNQSQQIVPFLLIHIGVEPLHQDIRHSILQCRMEKVNEGPFSFVPPLKPKRIEIPKIQKTIKSSALYEQRGYLPIVSPVQNATSVLWPGMWVR